MNRLLLGSGHWHWPGWVTVDGSAANEPNYVATFPPLPDAVKAVQWDEIMAIHVIEHVARWKVEGLLRECHAILKPGGKLILEAPNILYCAKVLLGEVEPPAGGAPGQFDMNGFYGDQSFEEELMLHRWGYTPDSLSALLKQVGQWAQIEQQAARFHMPVRDFRVEAVK